MKLLALIAFTSAATFACAVNIPLTQEELVRRTQELYDAVAFAKILDGFDGGIGGGE